MAKRSKFIKQLHQSEKFKAALAAARNPAERQLVAEIAESFVESFSAMFEPLLEQIKNDPTLAQKLGRQLIEQQELVTASEPITSGSTG